MDDLLAVLPRLLSPSSVRRPPPAIDDVLAAWPEHLRDHVSSETHASAVELRTGVHATVGSAVAEMGELRTVLVAVLDGLGLVAGGSGTHPSAVWHEMQVSSRERHQEVYGSMRELARREPTFALHVHVGLPSGEAGIAAFNRLRAHVPVLLALSANSPSELVDPVRGRAVPVLEIAVELMQACRPHAAALGCSGELELLCELLDNPGPARQRAVAPRSGLDGLAAAFAVAFEAPLTSLQLDAA